ncbi:hypothetical protein DL95DRAFT_440081 [Leptodontidium sp. 2 PMI_412]|nr:hypothetical protein DL95DRAFT_440081 [Leptodontidium sp. 2 PMI_412]
MDSPMNSDVQGSPDESTASPELFHLGGNRHAPRSKAGCWTCRGKKVKCDEVRPSCSRCVRLSRDCDYIPRQRKKCGPRRPKIGSRHSPKAPTEMDDGSLGGSISSSTSTEGSTERRTSTNGSLITRRLQVLSDLPPPTISAACSLVLSSQDHEAIQHFRTSFAIRQHTKNPKYSVLSIIFRLAESNAMVMHMVTAIAGQEISYLESSEKDGVLESSRPAEHYGDAIRILADTFKNNEAISDMDSILATLWLMMQYEQRFGDGHGMGLKSHLSGLAAVLRTKYPALSDLLGAGRGFPSASLGVESLPSPPSDSLERTPLSTFATRMLVWFSSFDASAATYGLGGQVNSSLTQLLSQVTDEDEDNPIRGYFKVHQHSNSLFRTVWGESYPQSELLDDLENREIFYLFGSCGQLRYMVADLARRLYHEKDGAEEQIAAVEGAIRLVGRKHAEILRVATSLVSDEHNQKRLISNVRYIVPNFHATVLQFLRITRFDKGLDERQRLSLREIMTLAFKSFKQEGDTAMMRITWPLFMAGLETDDLLHREWILDRFRNLGRFGMNYKRAFLLLEAVIDQQERLGERVNMLDLLDSGCYESFVV